MTDLRERVSALCAGLPGAELTDPWGGGHDAWKICGKMFASIGAVDSGVSVKTPDIETASMLIDSGIARRARYFHKSWVNLPDEVSEDELRHRILTSYDIVRASLTKKVQSTLVPREGS